MAHTPANKQDSQRLWQGLGSLVPYLRLLRQHLFDVIWVHTLMIVSTAVSLAIPLFAGRFVDSLTKDLGRRPSTPVLLLLGGLLLIQLATTYLYTVVSARLGLGYVSSLRKQLFSHMLELPSLFFAQQKGGDLSSRMTSDVGSIQYLMTAGIVVLARAAMTLCGAIILMFHLNVRLTLVILALVPATILLVRLFGNRLERLSRKMYRELGQISSHVQEVTGAIRVIKVYNSQQYERSRFAGMADRYCEAGVHRARLSAALESGGQILLWLCLITVVVYGFYLTAQHRTTFGDLVTFFLLAYRVAFPMGALTSLFASAQGAVAAAGRLADIFALAPESTPQPTNLHPAASGGAITLENVSFSYGTAPIIHNVSLRIRAGEWIGIVGPSGAGKTTLTGLIMRLFDPQQGRLLLDGQPYRDYDLKALRGQMAFVSQEPVLYDMSILDNIRFGRTEATIEEVREAARKANALGFIEALPEGLQTLCGERGVRLSGGERQRITLARAFLRNPRILVLDEPTSALDAQSEEAVRVALGALMQGRTAIVVAHRLSLVRDLNRVFVLADGSIKEEGDHAELMARQGLYHSLYTLQHGMGPPHSSGKVPGEEPGNAGRTTKSCGCGEYHP